MPFECRQAEVSLADIDSGIDTFRITTNNRVAELASAMDRVGLTHPPILKKMTSGSLVVCGFRRIAAAKALGWVSIHARILPEETAPITCALLAISENVMERPLNLIETSRAFSLLSSLIEKKEELRQTSEKIGLLWNPSLVNKLLPLCTLPQPLQEAILSGNLALTSVMMLSNLPDETAVAFADFLKNLKLSLHKQRELIVIIQEIAIREDRSVLNLLKTADVCHILENPEMDLPRKAGMVREYFKKRRFPHLTRSQDEFDRIMGRLKLGEHVSLKPPPGFESNRYALSLSFESLPELKKQINALEKLAESDDFVHLICSRDPLCD